jgi:hypothetical protein
MLADFYTKPLQGKQFRSMRNLILNCDPTQSAIVGSEECVGNMTNNETEGSDAQETIPTGNMTNNETEGSDAQETIPTKGNDQSRSHRHIMPQREANNAQHKVEQIN